MTPYLWINCLLMISITTMHAAESIPCSMEGTPYYHQCFSSIAFEITCQNYVDFYLTQCDDYYSYNSLYRYNFTINIKNPRENEIFVNRLQNYPEIYLTKLTLEDGNLTAIPEELLTMARIEKIKVTGNKIASINFDNFLSIFSLNEIDLSNNTIKIINIEEKKKKKDSVVDTIDISYNIIEFIPKSFLRQYTRLLHLNLSHNKITNIDLLAFEKNTELKTLDISFNRLVQIEIAIGKIIHNQLLTSNNLTKDSNDIIETKANMFQNLTKLEVLNLEYNKIEKISQKLLINNVNLRSLLLTNNSIHVIEANAFKDMKLTEFSIEHNELTGGIEGATFNGVSVKGLNLSGGRVTTIKDYAFINMTDLSNLDLSWNAIRGISPLAFSSLVSLDKLDLSHNHFVELNFETQDLRHLSKLYAQHNNIEKITKVTFDNTVSLKELDLSYNNIKEIDSKPFANMNKLETLTLTNNVFLDILANGLLQGLTSLRNIEISRTNITIFRNESFAGLVSLRNISCKFGNLKIIEYNAFLNSGPIEILNLSHNELESFDVNVSTIYGVAEIYLDNNNIRQISGETFCYPNLLRTLNLSANKIKHLDSDTFKCLSELSYLYLSSNTALENIDKNSFKHFDQLKKLELHNTKTEIYFNSSVSIEVLELDLCWITDLNKVKIYNVKNLISLSLIWNSIRSINQFTFQSIPTLVNLDLSLNQITHIQPGSFLQLHKLSTLKLHSNRLVSFKFGAFNGPLAFKHLDLTLNELRTFDVKLLPSTEKLSLDRNRITYLNFKEFLETNISTLSIGDNLLPCETLAQLKFSNYSVKFTEVLTANPLDYYSENVDGISCKSNNEDDTSLNSNNTDTDGNIVTSILNNAVKKLDNIEKTFQHFVDTESKFQNASLSYREKLTATNNDIDMQLREIKKSMTFDDKLDADAIQ